MSVNLVDTRLLVDSLLALIVLKDMVRSWEQLLLVHVAYVRLKTIFRDQGI